MLITLLILLAAWPAWLRGGTPAYTQGPLPYLGLAVLAVAWFGPRRQAPADRAAGGRRAWRDPLLYISLAFLALLALQWWNAGRVLFFDPVEQNWIYSLPRHPGWPFAFSRPEAAEMIRWFLPAACAALALRSGRLGRRGIRTLWRGLTLSAAVLSAVGLAQQAAEAAWLPYTQDLDVRFFASFGYENHAASFFVLAAALAAGLFVHDAVAARQSPGRTARLVAGGVALTLNLAATQLSLSRAGILLGWLLLIAGAAWIILNRWPLLSPPGRVNLVAGTFAGALALALFVHGYGHERLRPELESLRGNHAAEVVLTFTEAASGNRIELARAAIAIGTAHPAFGVGGWGFRYLLPYSQTDEGWQWTQREGMANVHLDPLQFLVEFGLVGGLLLAAACLVLLAPVLSGRDGERPWMLSDPLIFFPLLGLALVLLHSLIDLPFRSPAILLSWTLTAAGAGVLVRGRRSEVRDPRSEI